jgi:sporulation protein YlmC with PRC-barrel domain
MANFGSTTGSTSDRGVALEETGKLIAASKVEGTNVYNGRGDSLGSIYDVMIDKRSGKVAYAIMSFGGFLGIGEEYHPLPWNLLNYDTSMGGYVVDLDKDRLMGAPRFGSNDRPNWTDPKFTRGIDDYYGVPPYTM